MKEMRKQVPIPVCYPCTTKMPRFASNAEHVKGGIRVNCKASCTPRCGQGTFAIQQRMKS